jgi:hypothetical protein
VQEGAAVRDLLAMAELNKPIAASYFAPRFKITWIVFAAPMQAPGTGRVLQKHAV